MSASREISYCLPSRGRTEPLVWCGFCGKRLSVDPPYARTIQCAVCGQFTSVDRPQTSSQQIGVVKEGKKWVKRFFTHLTSGLNSPSGTSGSQRYWGCPSQPTQVQPMAYQQPTSYYNDYNYPYRPATSYAAPTGYAATARGRKRALLIGVSYKGKSYELKGTANDVQCMQYFLQTNFGFPPECIDVLTEMERNPARIPTRQNMLEAMRRLVRDCRSGDSLVFHFSGHGSQKIDLDGDEVDGYDETLCPMDYEANGMILDDDINDILVRPLVQGVTLHAIIDSCHSGTVLDLPYLCRMDRMGNWMWENHSSLSRIPKGTQGGRAISISGCDDNQTSADTTALSGGPMTGAMTYSFIRAVLLQPRTTYAQLLANMRTAIREAQPGIRLSGPLASLFRRVFQFGLIQEPQLCSSDRFDVSSEIFHL